MIIEGDSYVSTVHLRIEYGGEPVKNCTKLDLTIGKALVWSDDFTSLIETTFDVDKLHVYLLKPKQKEQT